MSLALDPNLTQQPEESSVGLQRIKCRLDHDFRHRELALRKDKFQRSNGPIVFPQPRV